MIRKFVFAAGLALAPQLAAAQTVVTHPQLLAVAKQTLVVLQQQLYRGADFAEEQSAVNCRRSNNGSWRIDWAGTAGDTI